MPVKNSMNSAQKNHLRLWTVILCVFIAGAFNYSWMDENWTWLKWPTLFAIIVASLLYGKESAGWGQPETGLNEFIETFPMLKKWLAISTLTILTFIAVDYGEKSFISEYPGWFMISGFVSIFLPLFITSEVMRFKRLANKSDD